MPCSRSPAFSCLLVTEGSTVPGPRAIERTCIDKWSSSSKDRVGQVKEDSQEGPLPEGARRRGRIHPAPRMTPNR